MTAAGCVSVGAAEAPEEFKVENAAMCLADNWSVYPDGSNDGERFEWQKGFLGKGTVVSLPYETSAQYYMSVIWFANTFTPDFTVGEGQRVILEFEGVQYSTKVWLNGNYLGLHEGSYGQFSFDVTDYLLEGEENLLALRLYSPKNNDKHNGLEANQLPVWLGGIQHIQTPVYVRVVSEVSIRDTYLTPDFDSGVITADVGIYNPTDAAAEVAVDVSVSPYGKGTVLDRAAKTVTAQPGMSTHTFTVAVDDFIAWSPDNPYLYDVTVRTQAAGAASGDQEIITTGFKSLYVDDEGFFILNGERIFIKSAHTAPYVIGSVDVGTAIEQQLHVLDYMKSAGFNMVRFIDGPALPEMMDYCDRIGLMVYEETAMSWTQVDSSQTEELFRREVEQLLRRDRNHVSFAILGMLNEVNVTDSTKVRYGAAVGCLDVVRETDYDILALLSSGRWDNDRMVGSASNPGSHTWDGLMGDEGYTDEIDDVQFMGMGDVHYYPTMPYNANIRGIFAAIGGRRAAFLSEAGAGSQANIVSDYRLMQQTDNPAINDGMNQSAAAQIAVLKDLFTRYNISSAFGSPEAFLIATQELQAQQRALLSDYIRSNPRINGYSLTQAPDIGYRGEGILEGSMEHKPGMYDALLDSWADLRWCLNIDGYNLYNDQTLDVDFYLSNLDVLKDQEYAVTIRITGADGTKYKKDLTIRPLFDANGRAVYAIPVLKESISLADIPAGEYTISATIAGATAASGTKTFWVNDRAALPKVSGTVYQRNLSQEAIDLLTGQGATVLALDVNNIVPGSTVIIGSDTTDLTMLEKLYPAVKNQGVHLIGLSAGSFGEWGATNLPFAAPGLITTRNNWLYHYDSLVLDTPVTSGLQTSCIMDPIYYETVYTGKLYSNITDPDEAHVVSLFVGHDGGATSQALWHGVACGSYNYGKGVITVNTLNITDSIGSVVADTLLLNLVNYTGP